MQQGHKESVSFPSEMTDIKDQYYKLMEMLRRNGASIDKYFDSVAFEKEMLSELNGSELKRLSRDIVDGAPKPTTSLLMDEVNRVPQHRSLSMGTKHLVQTSPETSWSTKELMCYCLQYLTKGELKMIQEHNLMAPMTKEDVQTMTDKRCMVCFGDSTGINYGKLTCQGCRCFFRRTVRLRRVYMCENTQNNKTIQSLCKRCRFRRCLLIGMSPAGAWSGRLKDKTASNQDYGISDDETDESSKRCLMTPDRSIRSSPSPSVSPLRLDTSSANSSATSSTTSNISAMTSSSTSMCTKIQRQLFANTRTLSITNCNQTEDGNAQDARSLKQSRATLPIWNTTVDDNSSRTPETAEQVIRRKDQETQTSLNFINDNPPESVVLDDAGCLWPPALPISLEEMNKESNVQFQRWCSNFQNQSKESDSSQDVQMSLLLHPELISSAIQQHFQALSVPITEMESLILAQTIKTMLESLFHQSADLKSVNHPDFISHPLARVPQHSTPSKAQPTMSSQSSFQSSESSCSSSISDDFSPKIAPLGNECTIQQKSQETSTSCSLSLLSRNEIHAMLKASTSCQEQSKLEEAPYDVPGSYQMIIDVMTTRYGTLFETGSRHYFLIFLIIILIHFSNFWANDKVFKDTEVKQRWKIINDHIITKLQNMAYTITEDSEIFVKRIAELVSLLTNACGFQQRMFRGILAAYITPCQKSPTVADKFVNIVIEIMDEMNGFLSRIHPYLILMISTICFNI